MNFKTIDLDEIWKIKLSGERYEEIIDAVNEEMETLGNNLIKRGFTNKKEAQYLVATLFTELLIYAFIDNEEDMDEFMKFVSSEAKEEILYRKQFLDHSKIINNIKTNTVQ